MTLSSDTPIVKPGDDEFGRGVLARRLAVEAVSAPPDEGFVIGLCGAWGSGKTSVLNLASNCLAAEDDIETVRFNPWLFSGSDDLIGRFFKELATALGRSEGPFARVAGKLGIYAGALSGFARLVPVAGGTISTAMASAAELSNALAGEPPLETRRLELASVLEETNGRLVVFLDDLDRLRDEEIRDVVRLVKLVGDLPRITYVLAFDRLRVEEALGGSWGSQAARRQRGRAYLEKIVQSRHDVPPPRPGALIDYFTHRLDRILARFPNAAIVSDDWNNMLGRALRHMVRTPRDALRVANAFDTAMSLVGDEVCATDLIGLEALRVLEPDVHAQLVTVQSSLVAAVTGFLESEDERRRLAKDRMDGLLRAARHPQTRDLLGQLFPKAAHALGTGRSARSEARESRDNRVSTARVLQAYLHAGLDDDAPTTLSIVELIGTFSDPQLLRETLAAVSDGGLDAIITRTLDYVDLFRPEDAETIAVEYMALFPRLAQDVSPFQSFEAPVSWRLQWVIEGALRTVADDLQRQAMTTRVIETAPSLSWSLRAINFFGTGDKQPNQHEAQPLLDAVASQACRDHLREIVAASRPEDLSDEPGVLFLLDGLLYPPEDESAGRECVAVMAQSDELMAAVLRASVVPSDRVVGSNPPSRQLTLRWKLLERLFGMEFLAQRISDLEKSARDVNDDSLGTALDLARRLLDGTIEPDPEL